MGYGLYDYDRRYRRRIWGGITRVGFYVVTIGVAALFAYQIGVEQVAGREEHLNDRIEVLEDQNQRLTGDAVRLEAQARTALAQYQEMRELYDRNLPTGVRNWLLNLVDDRLDAGIAPERIALYLDASSEPEGCSDPVSRRFIMPTPNFTGDNTSVGFGEGLVTVTGRGQGAVDDDGTTQAWFDPANDRRSTASCRCFTPWSSAIRSSASPLNRAIAAWSTLPEQPVPSRCRLAVPLEVTKPSDQLLSSDIL